VVELVVGAECEQRSDSDAVRVEDLGSAVDPALAVREAVPVGREEVLDAVPGTVQRESLSGQDGQDDVGERGREPDDLEMRGKRRIRTCLGNTIRKETKSGVRGPLIRCMIPQSFSFLRNRWRAIRICCVSGAALNARQK
jgi:hypothetical protein